MSEIIEFNPNSINFNKKSFFICAGGFEDRVKGIVNSLGGIKKKLFKYCNILAYHSTFSLEQSEKYTEFMKINKKNLEYLERTLSQLSDTMLPNTIIDIDNISSCKKNLKKMFNNIPNEDVEAIFIDISGMANFLILLVIHEIREKFYDKKVYVLYTEAKNYYPSEKEAPEILELAKRQDDDSISKLGEMLGASGTRETIILPDFVGNFREDLPICLIFFVGYEPSRAIGLLETYRPNLVIACYGISPHNHFKWRAKFSKDLFKKFNVFNQYSLVETEVSTFYINPQPSSELEIIPKLEELYTGQYGGKILHENYNVAITPQCSKLQTIASYLFCQSHPDIQVVFCLPGYFKPERYSEGIGESWMYVL